MVINYAIKKMHVDVLNICILTRVSLHVVGVQSVGVGQAVNGDHTGGGSYCQKTQSGQERSLWESRFLIF